jgi:hypothetical protein
MTVQELEKMSFEQLIKWSQSCDWEKVTSEEWSVYKRKCEQLAKKYFRDKDISQLEEFYRTNAGDGVDPWFEAWEDSMRDCFPLSELYEKLNAIENTLEVILKQMDKEPANITVGQLNRLKRGI